MATDATCSRSRAGSSKPVEISKRTACPASVVYVLNAPEFGVVDGSFCVTDQDMLGVSSKPIMMIVAVAEIIPLRGARRRTDN